MHFESNKSLTEFDRRPAGEAWITVARSVEVAPAGMPRTEVADVQIGVSDQSVGYAGPQTVDEDDFEVVNARRSKASPLSCTLSVRSCVGLRCNISGGSERHTPSPYCRVIVEQDEGDRSAQQTLACWQEADPTWDEEFELQDLSLGAVVRLEVWGQSSDGDEFLGEATVSRETLWQHQDALEAGGFEQELSLQTNLTKHIEAASGVLRVSWQTKGKARIWTRPSHSKALAHRSRSRPWDTSTEMPHKPRPLTSSFLMEGQLGEGIVSQLTVRAHTQTYAHTHIHIHTHTPSIMSDLSTNTQGPVDALPAKYVAAFLVHLYPQRASIRALCPWKGPGQRKRQARAGQLTSGHPISWKLV